MFLQNKSKKRNHEPYLCILWVCVKLAACIDLAASGTVQKCKLLKMALETKREITMLVIYSPRRENLFNQIKDELAHATSGDRVF